MERVELSFTDTRTPIGMMSVLNLYGGVSWVEAIARGDQDCLLCGVRLTIIDTAMHLQLHAPHHKTGVETMLNTGACRGCLRKRGGDMRRLARGMAEYLQANSIICGDDLKLEEAA